MVAIELVSYRDPESSLAFDFPAGWMLDKVVMGERAPSGFQLTSWAHEPGMVSEVPEGSARWERITWSSAAAVTSKTSPR